MNHIWITSDWHLGHNMMVEKGYRPADYEERIERQLAASVKPGDTLIHLGDVSLYPSGADMARAMLCQLYPTRRCLVRGNHDSSSLRRYLNDGWDWVCDAMELDFGGHRWLFTHEPRATFTADWNVHGHLHAGEHRIGPIGGNRILISEELTDYRPVSMETLRSLRDTPEWRKDRFRAWEGGGDATK